MLFTVTEDELAAAERLKEAYGRLRLAEQKAGRITPDDMSPEAQAMRAEIAQLSDEADEAEAVEAVQRCRVKGFFNEKGDAALHGVHPDALLSVAEEVLDGLDGEKGQRIGRILRRVVLLIDASSMDEAILQSKAEALARKYKAYTSVGLPLDFVHAYLLRGSEPSVGPDILRQGVGMLQTAVMNASGGDPDAA